MTAAIIVSAMSRSRLDRAKAWLADRNPADEVVIIGASQAAANELARGLAREKGAAFGWYRFTLARLAAEVAAPVLFDRGLAPITYLGAEALTARLVHQTKSEGAIGRYHAIADTPGFPRTVSGA